MAEHLWRMRTYAPYSTSASSWFPNAWTYRDLYAIYRDDDWLRASGGSGGMRPGIPLHPVRLRRRV